MVAAVVVALAGAALAGAPAPAGAPDRAPAPAPAAGPLARAASAIDPAARAPAPGGGAAPALVHYVGRAFDTCEAPSLAVMKAWRSSPYGAVGIYFGGRGRGCPTQRELSPAWVASVDAMGWRLLPLFVGSQAPCVNAAAKRPFAIGSSPVSQGTREGSEAVRAAQALGLDVSSPLYLDIEAYEQGDAGCTATTLSFVRAWNREVTRLGYVPGYYSSADTGVQDIEAERRAGTQDLPAVMWFARWLGRPALYTESVLQPEAWTPHARIHQYAGNVTEAYGGRSLAIDRNAMDAPVARVIPMATREGEITDSARVTGSAWPPGSARLPGSAWPPGSARLPGSAWPPGSTQPPASGGVLGSSGVLGSGGAPGRAEEAASPVPRP
ncbi:DUF1906 domain-containing protein [Streptomyces sp. NPDC006553]|uniref:DUF1906 domain-containing protein n=1 Tax=Streptomyces sp. NPDC006553 TaxID=3157180 RepID=UPI0033BE75DC